MRRREFITLISGGEAGSWRHTIRQPQSLDQTRRIALLSGLAATDPRLGPATPVP